jgi:hypothetical protein
MKVKITKIYTTDKDKQGNALISKQGKPYTRMSIKCQEYGDKWVSGFKNSVSGLWKEGDEVEINVEQKGEYLNFDTPKKDDKVIEMLSDLLIKIGKINANVEYIKDKMFNKVSVDHSAVDPDTGIDLNENPEDIPF